MDLAAALLWTVMRIADLQPRRIAESVTVVASPSPIATPAAVTRLGRSALQNAPAATLDDTLRSVPGFSLFRRSSSRVSNPTTQGATLRGLAASGASRALVLADGVPLNDPVGGWVYWNRVPVAAFDQVSVARGAAGDLHGADALAGVVNIQTSEGPGLRVLAEGGSHASARGSAFAGGRLRRALVWGAAEAFTTGGFVTVAPESRGAVDTAASSRHASVHAAAKLRAAGVDATLRGSQFTESRRNGTPVQRNATRISQLSASLDGLGAARSGWAVRAYASSQNYRQTFSAVLAGRASERQTSAQEVGAAVAGAQADYWWQDATSPLQVSAQFAGRRVAADLIQTPYDAAGSPLTPTRLDAAQASLAAAGQGSYRAAWLAAGLGLRVERWQSTGGNAHVVTNPRVWFTASPAGRVSFTVALQSGFRGPTINELYRPFRVGSILTNANDRLRPERVRGLEGGVVWRHRHATARVQTFWSRVDDAIVNVTLSSSGGTILRQRRNAARIRSAGAEVEIELRPARGVVLSGSSAFTDSIFLAGPLERLRVPQVPRVQHSAAARVSLGRARLSAEWRYIGSQFDDDRNAFELHRSSILDARAGWSLRDGLELFGAIENALDEEQDVGRTPLRTLGLPRTSRVGVRVVF